MFTISPINEKEKQKEYATACGAAFRPDFFAYAMIDGDSGEIMGFSQFEIDGLGGYISDLKPKLGYSDFEAMFILGRATMNFIDMCGVHTCRAAKDSADSRLLHAIGFKAENGENYIVDMTGMFDGSCGGHSVNLNKDT